MSNPTTNAAPGKSSAFAANVAARVTHTGPTPANCATRRSTSSGGSSGLSTLATLSSNATGTPSRAAATAARVVWPWCSGLNDPAASQRGRAASARDDAVAVHDDEDGRLSEADARITTVDNLLL